MVIHLLLHTLHDRNTATLKKFALHSALAGALPAVPAAAAAHVTLDSTEARVGSYYKAVLRVPHGCAGSPTVKLRVRIPEGVIAVEPQPNPGWTLSTVHGDYQSAYTLHGATLLTAVREVAWSGGPLPEDQFGEFAFMAYLADDLPVGKPLRLPAVQECDDGVARWIAREADSSTPAPALMLLPGT